jgi:hypothetical protein
MVDLVVVKCIGSKNQSIRGKSWVPLLTFQERLLSITDFSKNRVARTLVFCVVFYRPFLSLSAFFFWPLHCLSSYLRLRIVPLLQIVQSHRSITSHEFRMGGALSMADCQVIIRKAWPWTIVGNVLGECHDPCMQKDLYCRFRQRAGAL